MAASVNTSGTSSQSSGGAEATLATITTAGSFALVVDTRVSGAAMAGGSAPDIVRLRGYIKPTSTGAETLLFSHELIGAQSRAYHGFYWPSPVSIRFTIEQPQGTARALPWAVWQL